MRDLTEEEKNLEKRDPESEVLDEEGARRLRETQRHIFFFFFVLKNTQADQLYQCKSVEMNSRANGVRADTEVLPKGNMEHDDDSLNSVTTLTLIP